jgi:ribosomal protein S18 acetylase RimI-like enzyme
MQYKIRILTCDDQWLLWELLYLSLYVPKAKTPFKRSVLEQPEISKDVSDWGRTTDLGFVANDENNQPLGAVWLRLLAGEESGYGYVNDTTPELGMAVFPNYRGQGIGTNLLTHLIESAAMAHIEQISLSVAVDSSAVRLYQRLGFKIVDKDEASFIMLRKTKQQKV